MLTGAHVLIMSTNAAGDASFLREVLELPHVDAGDGFLIFGLPPAEVAVHDAHGESGGRHELFLIASDVHSFVERMIERSIPCEPIVDRGWGTVTSITLPSGLKLGVYEAHHPRPVAKKKTAKALRETAKVVRRATKKAAKAAKKSAKRR